MGWLSTLADAAINGIPGSIDRQGRQADVAAKQQGVDQADLAFHQHLIDAGALPVVGGVVKRTMYDGGNSDVGAPPTNGGLLDKADPSRVINYKPRGGGDAVQYELPTLEQQHGRQIWQQMQDAVNPMAQTTADVTSRREASAEQANSAAISGGTEMGQQQAKNTSRQQYGITLPPGSGVADGTKVLPEELAGVTQGSAAAAELPQKLFNQRLANASQALGSVTQPGAYQAIYNGLPEDVKSRFDAPENFEPLKSPMRARMATMSPEDQQKTSLMMNASPEDWDKAVDGVAPPAGDTAALNRRTKVLVQSALRRGDWAKADATIKDASDQLGRTETGVRTAKATEPIKINLAAGETNARNNANTGGAPGGTGGAPGASGTGSALNPGMESLANQVANYQVNPTTALSRIPFVGRQALMGRVQELNPDFHQEYYDNFKKTEADATTGKIGTSANAISTGLGHLNVLNSAVDALKGGNLPQLNKFANLLGVQTGSDPVTVFNTIVHRLGPEVTKAYLASGGSVGERGANEADFDPSLSPDQLKANIGVSAQLFGSKIDALNHQYQQGTYRRGKQKLLTPEAEQARQHLLGQAPAALRGGLTPTHTLHGRPIAVDPKTNTWVFVDDGKPAQ